MKIKLNLQATVDQTLPPLPVKIFTGSALPLELEGIPGEWAGGEVVGVSVTVKNADGVDVAAECALVGNEWQCLFAGSNFPSWGFVENGVRITVAVKRSDDTTAYVIVGVADFDIKPATTSASPGTPGAMVAIKGGDVYLKTQVLDGVQHYTKQQMAFDSRVGWGATWTGDYILTADGDFVPFSPNP